MTIIALLIALALERIAVKTPKWQAQYYAREYFDWLKEKNGLSAKSGSIQWLLITVLPAIVVMLVLDAVPSVLLEFVLHTFILFICLGSQALRDVYKCFLQAANRGDYESCYLYSQQMGHCNTKPDKAASFGLQLVWLNYQHYAAVVLWFVAFGAAGAVFYVLVREGFDYCCETPDFSADEVAPVRKFADWLPVRIAAFGMLLVGNFAHGLPVWLAGFFNMAESPSTTMTKVSAAAEILPDEQTREADPTLEPSMLVKLAKRNLMFMLVAVSLLTVAGVL